MKKLYTLAMLNNKGEPRGSSLWLDAQDLNTDAGVEAVKLALMSDCLSLEDPEDAKAMNAYYTAHLSEAPTAPADNEIVTTGVRRYDVQEGSTAPVEGEPEYKITTKSSREGVVVSVELVDAELGDSGKSDRLDSSLSVWVEINGGVPVAHLYASADELVQSVFAMPDGKLHTRPGDGAELMAEAPKGFSPEIGNVIQAMGSKTFSTDALRER